jgi:hypothetical protein
VCYSNKGEGNEVKPFFRTLLLTLKIMKTYKSLFIMGFTALTLSLNSMGCDSTGPSKAGQVTSQAPVSSGGTVVFRETGGGFYGILTDKGGQFEPKNLDERFRTDGLRISFTGQLDTSKLGDHHWGNPIELANVIATK